MSLYEHIFIARQDLPAQQVDVLVEEYTKLIEDNGGKVVKTENWGLRNLAYKIKKNRKGTYVFFGIDAPAAAISELERNVRLNEDIIRYMTVRVEEIEEGPSAVLQSRGDRERGDRGDRGRRGDRGDRPARGRGEEAEESDNG